MRKLRLGDEKDSVLTRAVCSDTSALTRSACYWCLSQLRHFGLMFELPQNDKSILAHTFLSSKGRACFRITACPLSSITNICGVPILPYRAWLWKYKDSITKENTSHLWRWKWCWGMVAKQVNDDAGEPMVAGKWEGRSVATKCLHRARMGWGCLRCGIGLPICSSAFLHLFYFF